MHRYAPGKLATVRAPCVIVMRYRAFTGLAVEGFGTLKVVIAPFVTDVQKGVEITAPPPEI
jgi:hypothetical protein